MHLWWLVWSSWQTLESPRRWALGILHWVSFNWGEKTCLLWAAQGLEWEILGWIRERKGAELAVCMHLVCYHLLPVVDTVWLTSPAPWLLRHGLPWAVSWNNKLLQTWAVPWTVSWTEPFPLQFVLLESFIIATEKKPKHTPNQVRLDEHVLISFGFIWTLRGKLLRGCCGGDI